MKAEELRVEELRVGNLVCTRSGFEFLVEPQMIVEPFGLYPIPITEEWLIKVGAEEWPHKKYRKFKIGMLMIGSTNNMETFSIVNLNMKHFKYEHQLQNLYHALTGEELIN